MLSLMSGDDYELVQVLTADEWRAVHDMRRTELFVRRPSVVYDENHPDDRMPGHFLFLLLLKGEPIGTARFDLAAPRQGIMRLVAITRAEQRKGHGRVLHERFETFARGMGVTDLYVNAAPEAVGFYERMGFVHEDWEDKAHGRKGIASDTVPMRKRL
jgi:N-acetylglutamate synthase-like GNAT family acetyltransferase